MSRRQDRATQRKGRRKGSPAKRMIEGFDRAVPDEPCELAWRDVSMRQENGRDDDAIDVAMTTPALAASSQKTVPRVQIADAARKRPTRDFGRGIEIDEHRILI